MPGQRDPIWVPSGTDIARARVTAFAEFAARTHRYRTWAQLRTEARAVNPHAKSAWKISATITSPGAAS